MISFLRGMVVSVTEKQLLLDVNNVGFQVFISARDAAAMPDPGEEVLIHTCMSVKEDDISLFGFLREEDLAMYRLLITVNGIGPKAAISILSVMDYETLGMAIIADDEKSIAKAPGLGAKTARKLILELKDKIDAGMLTAGLSEKGTKETSAFEAAKAEAVQVLEALGYSKSEALKAVRTANLSEDMDADQILSAALTEHRS